MTGGCNRLCSWCLSSTAVALVVAGFLVWIFWAAADSILYLATAVSIFLAVAASIFLVEASIFLVDLEASFSEYLEN